MAIPRDWRFKGASSTCHHSGLAFKPGDQIYTALFLNAQEEIIRRDYHAHAWAEVRSRWAEHPDEAPFSHWKSQFKGRSKPQQHTSSSEPLARMMSLLVGEDSSETEESSPDPSPPRLSKGIRFLICLYLERAKMLKLRETHQGTKIYEHRKTGEIVAAENVEPQAQEITRFHEIIQEVEESGAQD